MLTKSGLRLGVALPQTFLDGKVDRNLVRDFAIRAEEIGYEDVWLTESILGAAATLEPVTLLAYTAAITERIRLGVAVIILNTRNPVQLAKSLASLDQLSGGRVNAGVGLGATTRTYPAFGIGEEHRVARFNEALRVMKALWTEPEVNLEGDFWQLRGASISPRPLQQPHIPIWFGATSPEAIRRAARHGDAWMSAGSSELADAPRQIEDMRSCLAEQGRDASKFTLSKRIYVAVDEDGAKAEQRMADYFGYYYRNPERAKVSGIAGSPSQCVDALSRLRDAGYNHLLLNPVHDFQGQMELLTEKVAPQL
jgi:probable F420-dependent oxidoreductase